MAMVTDKNNHDINPLDPVRHGEAFVNELKDKIRNNPKDQESWFALGLEYFDEEWLESAKCFSRCIALDPFNAEYYFRRGRKYVSMDKWQYALADFSTATHINSEIAAMWHYKGAAYFFLENYLDAVECFRRSIELNIKYDGDLIPPSVDWAWMAYQKMGLKEDALKVLDYVNETTRIAESDKDYKKRVLLYKGEYDPEEFYAGVNQENDLLGMAEVYGLANYYYYLRSDAEKSVKLLEETLAYPRWHHAFAYKLASKEIRSRREEISGR